MALSIIGALAGIASAGAGIYGATQSSANASAANKQAGATAAAGLQDSLNQQNYTKALNALALQRSIAGSVDSRGSTGSYDPSTNTWRTQLSPEAAAIQAGNDAYSAQNLRDVTQGNAQTLISNARNNATAGAANSSAMAAAAKARGSADSARRQLDNFRPMSANELEGDLQQVSTTANRQAQDPIIADTLRAMARTGTAAAPVLTAMQRDNATTLRQTMLQNHIQALQNAGQINNTNRQGLQSTFSTLDAAGTPKLQFPGNSAMTQGQINDPSAALSNEIASRAAGAGNTGIQAGAVSNQGRNADTNARTLAVNNTPYNNSGDVISSLAKQIGSSSFTGGVSTLYDKLFGGGAGNAGDKAWGQLQKSVTDPEQYLP